MSNKGFSHIELATLDLDRTRAFYQDVLGFEPVVADTLRIREGGRLRHLFFDVGRDQLLAFMEARDIPGVPVGLRCWDQSRTRCSGRLLSLRLRGGVGGIAGRQTQPAAQERREGHRHRRSRLGQVDLLPGSQRALAGVLLPDTRSRSGRCRHAGTGHHSRCRAEPGQVDELSDVQSGRANVEA